MIAVPVILYLSDHLLQLLLPQPVQVPGHSIFTAELNG